MASLKPRLDMTVATTVSPGSRPASRSSTAEDRHDLVAVDRLARGGDGQAAVGVAVVGDAGVGAVLDHGRAAGRPGGWSRNRR